MLSRRFYAYFIDLFLISLGNKIMLVTYLNFMDIYFPFLTPALVKNLPQISLFSQYLTFVGYFSLSLYMSEGKTLGKLCTGLKVISNKQGNPLSLAQCFLRASCALFSTIFLMLPYLLLLIRKDGRDFTIFWAIPKPFQTVN